MPKSSSGEKRHHSHGRAAFARRWDVVADSRRNRRPPLRYRRQVGTLAAAIRRTTLAAPCGTATTQNPRQYPVKIRNVFSRMRQGDRSTNGSPPLDHWVFFQRGDPKAGASPGTAVSSPALDLAAQIRVWRTQGGLRTPTRPIHVSTDRPLTRFYVEPLLKGIGRQRPAGRDDVAENACCVAIIVHLGQTPPSPVPQTFMKPS